MTMLTVSTKGQIVIPKEIRDELGFVPGAKVTVERNGDVVMLRVAKARQKLPASVLIGFLKPYYKGPPITEEQIGRASLEAVAERWERSKK